MELVHFSHEHPLILEEEHNNNGVEVSCYVCQQPISGPTYSCRQCQHFSLHKVCAELPTKMEHPMHPEHHLILLPDLPYSQLAYECSACQQPYESFTYSCFDCNFQLDILCALLSHSKCVADLCGALHCGLVMDSNSKFRKTKCNPAAAARNHHLCESLADSCFPVNQSPSANRLHELFLRQFCDAHTCSGGRKPFSRGGQVDACRYFYIPSQSKTMCILRIALANRDFFFHLITTIGEFASISDKAVVTRFFKTTMQKLLKVTQEASKAESSQSSNQMQIDNSSNENSLSLARAQLFDLAVAFLPGLDASEIDLLFIAVKPTLKAINSLKNVDSTALLQFLQPILNMLLHLIGNGGETLQVAAFRAMVNILTRVQQESVDEAERNRFLVNYVDYAFDDFGGRQPPVYPDRIARGNCEGISTPMLLLDSDPLSDLFRLAAPHRMESMIIFRNEAPEKAVHSGSRGVESTDPKIARSVALRHSLLSEWNHSPPPPAHA
ncbi:Guanine nucleotide exchange factor SPIKE 1 [Camellia lanceoleosa]|uniref:Guanine nucleotide exchange factor SPIKE 1 n=1 Tax=Camellia lanceoleosa TaxID=1840588 RepID=A0ACC0HA35_9ERIC|nr:Guanine nucleotide exchange factor SPIKE 1 [Camellia lanceoleosa]